MRLYRGQRIANFIENRQQLDDRLAAIDRSSWYLPTESLLTEALLQSFALSFLDPEAQSFLDDSFATSNSICTQLYYGVMTSLLSFFFSKTSINGILNRGGMFLFSEDTIPEFLMLPPEWNAKGKRMLDLGAGDGGITRKFKPFFEHIEATEMSQVMQYRLRQEGIEIADVEKWPESNQRYNLISALNLLDRHYNPKLLLQQMHSLALRSQCHVLIAVVLPIKQYVEFHPTNKTTRPDEYIQFRGNTFEEHVAALVQHQFTPAGFELVRWTKLPYLCEGDINRPFYMLSDAVFLLRPVAIGAEDVASTSNTVVHAEL